MSEKDDYQGSFSFRSFVKFNCSFVIFLLNLNSNVELLLDGCVYGLICVTIENGGDRVNVSVIQLLHGCYGNAFFFFWPFHFYIYMQLFLLFESLF